MKSNLEKPFYFSAYRLRDFETSEPIDYKDQQRYPGAVTLHAGSTKLRVLPMVNPYQPDELRSAEPVLLNA